MIDNIKKIDKKLKSEFYYNYETSKRVWFKAGGNALVYCFVNNQEELEIILNNIGDMNFEIIGAGSNILIRDKGFDGIIIKLGKEFNEIVLKKNNILEVGAGLLDINLAKYAKKNKIKNFEFYSGIPGTIGGAIKMNAGCYGYETKNIIQNIEIINSNLERKTLSKNEINLTYRNSSLKKNEIVTKAIFDCFYGDIEEIEKINKKIKIERENSQPLKTKTSGSTFKNPKNFYAAKLIEDAGCKGMRVGGVYVSEKHSNFLINDNNATASDIENLGSRIIDIVYNKFNIKLEWEIKIIGNKS